MRLLEKGDIQVPVGPFPYKAGRRRVLVEIALFGKLITADSHVLVLELAEDGNGGVLS